MAGHGMAEVMNPQCVEEPGDVVPLVLVDAEAGIGAAPALFSARAA